MMVFFTLLFLFSILPSLFQDVKMRHDMTEENEEDSRDTGTEKARNERKKTLSLKCNEIFLQPVKNEASNEKKKICRRKREREKS